MALQPLESTWKGLLARPSRPVRQSPPGAPPPLYLYFEIFAEGSRPTANEYFWLETFEGEERISTPFEYDLELRALADGASNSPCPPFRKVLGRSATVAIVQPGEQWDVSEYEQQVKARLHDGKPATGVCVFNGVVASFAVSAPGVFQATLRPSLWKLTLTNHYRSLHGSVAEVIKTVLEEHGMRAKPETPGSDGPAAYYAIEANGLAHDRVQDWLQTGESDYEFVQRLMGKANLYYYFEHGATWHTVVFSNRPPHRLVRPVASLVYTFTSAAPLGLERDDVIDEYRYEERLTSTGVEASAVTQQADGSVSVENLASYAYRANVTYGVDPVASGPAGALPFRLYRLFSYGGDRLETSVDVEQQARMLRASAATLSGVGKSPGFQAGYCFETVEGEHSGPENVEPLLNHKRFVLISVKHEAALDGTYKNRFEAISAEPDPDGSPSALPGPFDLHATRQTSVLGQVVDIPDHASDFLLPSAFSPKPGQLKFVRDGKSTSAHPTGVFVRLTGPGQEHVKPIWVALPMHMTSVPQDGALVLVSREQNDSELPVVEMVVDSHGSMLVDPGRTQGNTFVGNSDSTSYGESRSLRYGHRSPDPDAIEAAVKFVKSPESIVGTGRASVVTQETIAGGGSSAPPRPTVAAISSDLARTEALDGKGEPGDGGGFTEVSYSQGSSCSYASSEAGPDGLLSCSVSRGSDWSSRIGASSKSYTITGPKDRRQSADLQPLSFDNVVQGAQTWVLGDSANVSVNDGDTRSTATVTGRQLNCTAVGGAQLPAMPEDCAMGSSTAVNGNKKDEVTVRGTSQSTTTSDNESSWRTVPGQVESHSFIGSEVTTDQVGSRQSTSHVGTENTARTVGSSESFSRVDLSTSTSEVGAEVSHQTVGSSISISDVTSEVRRSSVGTSVSSSETDISVNCSVVGLSFSTSTTASEFNTRLVGASVSTGLVGGETSSQLIGAETSLRAVGAATNVSVTGVQSSTSVTLASHTTDIVLSGVKFSIDERVDLSEKEAPQIVTLAILVYM